MRIRLGLLSILLVVASLVAARSGFLTLAHADMMSETMGMDCTSTSPCFFTHTSEVGLAVPQERNLFLGLMAIVVLAFGVQRLAFRFDVLQERLRKYRGGITSLFFGNFCRDYIRHGLLAPKLNAVL